MRPHSSPGRSKRPADPATNPSIEVRFLRGTEFAPRPGGPVPPPPIEAGAAAAASAAGLATDDPRKLGEGLRKAAGPELAIGDTDDQLPYCFLEIGVDRGKAVCKIEASGTDYRGRADRQWTGTGFLVSESILLTNYHVLNSVDVARTAQCIFNFQVDPDGRSLPTSAFRLDPDRLFLCSPYDPERPEAGGLDFAFVWVDGAPGRQFGVVPLDRNFFKIDVGELANVIQHPDGLQKTVVVQNNTVTHQDAAVVHYTSDTAHGSSGAPVFSNRWRPVALHHASVESPAGTAHPAGPFINEGIKFSAIACALEQMAQKSPAERAAVEWLLPLFRGTDAVMGFFGGVGRPTTEAAGVSVDDVLEVYRSEPDDVDVGFWNLERVAEDATSPEWVARLARAVAGLNVDVWCFSEVPGETADALVALLRDEYGLDHGLHVPHPTPGSARAMQAVMWNRRTVDGAIEAWPAGVAAALDACNRLHADDAAGPAAGSMGTAMFPHHPALMRFTARNRERAPAAPFAFYLVPLHLDALPRASRQRRVAAQVLGAAIRRSLHEERTALDPRLEWMIGGDFTASAVVDDFGKLLDPRFGAVAAQDDRGGAFAYLKGPQSTVDRIILGPNLGNTFGGSDLLSVAREKSLPPFVQEVSNRRPVMARLALRREPAGDVSLTPSLPEWLTGTLAELNGWRASGV